MTTHHCDHECVCMTYCDGQDSYVNGKATHAIGPCICIPCPYDTRNNIIACIESCERTETRLVDFCRVCDSKKTCGVLVLVKYLKQRDATIRNETLKKEHDIIISKITTILGFDDPDEAYEKLNEWRKSLRHSTNPK